jgi:hypothetical protein
MKILLGYLNGNGLAGSEMYHYELARELHINNIDVTLFTLNTIDKNDQVRKKLYELGIKQVDLNSLNTNESFDIIVASQPQVNSFICNYFPNTPVISIIHSEIRSETPILHDSIKHYICIRPSIVDLLVKIHNIPKVKTSLIYNPIDTSRYYKDKSVENDKVTGLFIGGATDDIRFKTVCHLVQQCLDNDWNLNIMSGNHQRHDFNHPNIKYLDPLWYNESIVKNMDFTAGILLGRTTLEGLCCGIPGYVYDINQYGDIIGIELIQPDNAVVPLCDSKVVIKQHLDLYKKIINENNI